MCLKIVLALLAIVSEFGWSSDMLVTHAPRACEVFFAALEKGSAATPSSDKHFSNVLDHHILRFREATKHRANIADGVADKAAVYFAGKPSAGRDRVFVDSNTGKTVFARATDPISTLERLEDHKARISHWTYSKQLIGHEEIAAFLAQIGRFARDENIDEMNVSRPRTVKERFGMEEVNLIIVASQITQWGVTFLGSMTLEPFFFPMGNPPPYFTLMYSSILSVIPTLAVIYGGRFMVLPHLRRMASNELVLKPEFHFGFWLSEVLNYLEKPGKRRDQIAYFDAVDPDGVAYGLLFDNHSVPQLTVFAHDKTHELPKKVDELQSKRDSLPAPRLFLPASSRMDLVKKFLMDGYRKRIREINTYLKKKKEEPKLRGALTPVLDLSGNTILYDENRNPIARVSPDGTQLYHWKDGNWVLGSDKP